MKRVILSIALFCLVTLKGNTQSRDSSINSINAGIRFDTADSWQQIMEKANVENKYVFVDLYTTWCGPCKYMDQHIFAIPDVGDFFNRSFVNVHIQMDETSHDADRIKQWYPEAKKMERIYGIQSYPTFLFFSPDGQVVHRSLGSVKEGNDFIAMAKAAMDPTRQYYALVNGVSLRDKDSAYLQKLLKKAMSLNDDSTVDRIAPFYLAALKDSFSKENLSFLNQCLRSTQSAVFWFLFKNLHKIDSVFDGSGDTRGNIESSILNYEITPLCQSAEVKPDWEGIYKRLKDSDGDFVEYPLWQAKLEYYLSTNKQPEVYGKLLVQFMQRYKNDSIRVSNYARNDNAWLAFLVCNDHSVLLHALEWSRNTIESYPNANPNYIDTYANLLFKVHRFKKAIKWEKRTLAMAKGTKLKQEIADRVWWSDPGCTTARPH